MALPFSPGPDSKSPRLASASGAGGGSPHSLWRPQMITFLMRHGIEERDYQEEIPLWRDLVAAVQAAAKTKELEAIASVLGRAKLEPQAQPESAKKEKGRAPLEQVEQDKSVAELVNRSKKAFGFLFDAIPADLRLLVADVPQGYAFGIWSFLEKKFRNTGQDTVMDLWERLTSLRHETEESFDVFKARVDSVKELLESAKQTIQPGLYASILLRLQPRYAVAVLTLKTSDRVKDPATIDWPAIAEFMAQYERNHLGLGDTKGKRSMPVFDQRTWSRSNSKPSKTPAVGEADDHSDIQCFNCKELGHYRSDCPKPDRRKQQNKKRSGTPKQSRSPSTSEKESDSGDERREGRTKAAAAAAKGPGQNVNCDRPNL